MDLLLKCFCLGAHLSITFDISPPVSLIFLSRFSKLSSVFFIHPIFVKNAFQYLVYHMIYKIYCFWCFLFEDIINIYQHITQITTFFIIYIVEVCQKFQVRLRNERMFWVCRLKRDTCVGAPVNLFCWFINYSLFFGLLGCLIWRSAGIFA